MKTCEPHTCPCGKQADIRGLHGLASAMQQRHSQVDGIIWRVINKDPVPKIMTIIQMPTFIVQLSWQDHCISSLSSYNELSATQQPYQPSD